MILYDRQLRRIKNEGFERRIERLAQNAIDKLVSLYNVDRESLQAKLTKLAVVQRDDPQESHFVEYKGEKQELHNGQEAESFVTKKKQEYDGNKWQYENAIYTKESIGDHTINHELMHYFSDVLESTFDEKEITYDKSGVIVIGYDRQDNEVDDSLGARGLNEGITEFLARKVDGEKKSISPYEFQLLMADILCGGKDNTLIKAYFSDNKADLEKFLKEFEERQKTVKVQELVSVGEENGFNNFDDLKRKIYKGCIEYSLSLCKNEQELGQEKNRIKSIIQSICVMDFKTPQITKKYLEDAVNVYGLENSVQPIERQQDNKRKFIDGFIKAYNDTETEYQYEKRANDGLMDIKRLQDIIEANGMNRILTADLEGKWIGRPGEEDFKIQYSQKQVSAMARLLKVAQLLTQSKKLNPEGRNYLEEFTEIPDIENMLKQLKGDLKDNNSYMFELREKARSNRENGNIPIWPPTGAEIEADTTKDGKSGLILEQTMGISQAQKEQKQEQEEETRRKKEEEKTRQEDNEENRKTFSRDSTKPFTKDVMISEVENSMKKLKRERSQLTYIGNKRTAEQEARLNELNSIINSQNGENENKRKHEHGLEL